jgi:hypothetical protein
MGEDSLAILAQGLINKLMPCKQVSRAQQYILKNFSSEEISRQFNE